MKNIYLNFSKMFTYNALIYFLIGERGCGKSYGAKKYCANHFLKTNKQFVYIRRYKTELKEALYSNSEPSFFNQIKDDKTMKNHKLTNNNSTFFIDDKICGYAIPLSIANILKSSTYEKVDTIIFDEFIIDKGCYHYLKNEVTQLLELMLTIARLHDIKVVLIGNAISITNPYFDYFNLTLPYNSEYKTFKNGLIVLRYVKNLEYRKEFKKTKIGQLIDGTPYGEYAIDNIFLRDNTSFIMKKTKNSKFSFTLIINNQKLGIWSDSNNKLIFISNDYDPNYKITFSLNTNDHNENTILIKLRTSPLFKILITHYRLAHLYFENQKIKNLITAILDKHLQY